MNVKILLAILALVVICTLAYFILKAPPEKPRISEVTGEIEIPETEIGVPSFEEEPSPLDLGSLI